MNANIIPVNNDALSRAMLAVVGPETAAVIVKSYQELDKAMADGYKAGFEAGVKAENEASQNRADDAFERGRRQGDADQWEAGYAVGAEEASQVEYDDGYVDGVSDARVCPSDADQRVAELCAHDVYDHIEDDASYFLQRDADEWEARNNALGMAQLQY